jgi:hypothetical protein
MIGFGVLFFGSDYNAITNQGKALSSGYPFSHPPDPSDLIHLASLRDITTEK